METSEYYGGTYPEPPENKIKIYKFKMLCECEVMIEAQSMNEAEEFIETENINNLDIKINSIEDIIDRKLNQ